jgi:catechol 2,3-dioxygenase-like lactoylglutathione lyase family enzyme
MANDWELNHVGLVVKDWDRALDYYQSLNIGITLGPQPVYMDLAGGGPVTFYSYGKPRNIRLRHKLYRYMDKDCQIGSLQLELTKNRKAAVEGINHICFNVPDIKAETARLVEKGCEIILSFEQDDTIIENYLDTRKFCNVILSMRCPTRKWEKAWKAHNTAHPLLNSWKFRGVGVAVRDLDKVVEYYQSLGIAEFQPEVTLDSSSFTYFKVNGKTPDTIVRARTRRARIGPVVYEFVQPLDGEAIYKESLDYRGEGVNDMAFTVDDLEKEIAKLADRGVPVILSGKPQTGSTFAYFGTRKFGGHTMIQLIQAE